MIKFVKSEYKLPTISSVGPVVQSITVMVSIAATMALAVAGVAIIAAALLITMPL